MAPEYITTLLTPMSETRSLNLRSCDIGTLYIPMAHSIKDHLPAQLRNYGMLYLKKSEPQVLFHHLKNVLEHFYWLPARIIIRSYTFLMHLFLKLSA